jgi:hypothetical protein
MKIDLLFGKALKRVNLDVHMYVLSAHAAACFSEPAGPFECTSGRSAEHDLEALREDLLRLECGWRPSYADLERAPEFKNWGILDTGEAIPKIVGQVVGAPGDAGSSWGEKRMISHHVLARDTEFNWIRDRSSFYRLEPAEPLTRFGTPSERRRRSTLSVRNSRSGLISF